MRPVFYDLHLHSCLSPCGDMDMTPNNIVNMSLLKGLELIALTDHNSCKNCPATLAVAGQAGLAVIPGMEVGRDYTIVLRPEAAALAQEGGLPCQVVLSCFMGSYQNYHVKVGDTLVKLTDPNPKNKRVYKVGEHCRLVFDPENVHVL